MAKYDELVEALIWLLTNRVQSKINYSHGLLGDGQGRVRVAGHEDFVYARPDRFNSRTQQVFNKRVEGQDGDPIIIGELPWEPGLTQVISIDWRTYKEIGWGGDTSGFVYHGRTHIWKDAAPGLDTFPVYRRQLGDLQATASVSGTNAVDISSYSIELYGTQKQFPGTIGFPLDNAIPGGTGTARMALLYWDPSSGTTGYIGVATGTTGIDSESTLLNRPVSLPGTLPIAFVRLNAGMAGVTEFDIFDAREPFRPGIGFGTGSSQFHAGLIPIADNGGFYTGTSVESALQEIGGGGGAHTHDASDVSIADAGGYYTGTSVESALQEIGGGSLPGDTFKVSELWESDFGAVAWQTNAAGHLSATGKDLTTTGDISANDITASGNILLTSGATMVGGDGGSEPSLGASPSGNRWGNIYLASATFINALGNMDISTGAIGSEVRMIQLLNAAQDVLELGGIDGDDVDVNIGAGQVFVEGSSGKVAIGSTTILGALLQLSSATPSLYWEETDGAADNKIWQMNPSGESFGGFAVNDAVSASGQWLKVERTGTTIDSVSFPSADLDVSIKTADVTYTFITATTGVSLLIDDEDAANRRTIVMRRISDTAARGSQSAFLRARLGPAAVQSGDIVGYFNFEAHDGTDYELGAQFRATVDGAVSANTTPMSFSILTSPVGLAALANRLHITGGGLVGINNVTSPGAQLHVDQASTTAAIPVLTLDQADLSEEFINFVATVGAGNPIDTAAIGTYYGKIRVAVNGTFKFIPLHNS